MALIMGDITRRIKKYIVISLLCFNAYVERFLLANTICVASAEICGVANYYMYICSRAFSEIPR